MCRIPYACEWSSRSVDFSVGGLWAILRGSPVDVCDAMRAAGTAFESIQPEVPIPCAALFGR
jgi:hypothetical protein